MWCKLGHAHVRKYKSIFFYYITACSRETVKTYWSRFLFFFFILFIYLNSDFVCVYFVFLYSDIATWQLVYLIQDRDHVHLSNNNDLDSLSEENFYKPEITQTELKFLFRGMLSKFVVLVFLMFFLVALIVEVVFLMYLKVNG